MTRSTTQNNQRRMGTRSGLRVASRRCRGKFRTKFSFIMAPRTLGWGKFWDKQEKISEMTKSLSVTSENKELNFWTRKVKRPILIKFLRNVISFPTPPSLVTFWFLKKVFVTQPFCVVQKEVIATLKLKVWSFGFSCLLLTLYMIVSFLCCFCACWTEKLAFNIALFRSNSWNFRQVRFQESAELEFKLLMIVLWWAFKDDLRRQVKNKVKVVDPFW